MSRNSVTVDPADETKWTFTVHADWITEGITVSAIATTPSSTVTLISEGSVVDNAKTVEFSATASGSITALYTLSDGQKRERTLTITVTNL